ncbi:hypothetical protein E3N88_45756 [Mikania micrantha]|uniref:Uncharacterized protein n=1 Tax=Mikania micrantha TaxID=192012 RepID=A0A5N6L879_9ASTR|nr:hypothetical protein E3N88_45756 [Mikania micrantha]
MEDTWEKFEGMVGLEAKYSGAWSFLNHRVMVGQAVGSEVTRLATACHGLLGRKGCYFVAGCCLTKICWMALVMVPQGRREVEEEEREGGSERGNRTGFAGFDLLLLDIMK